MSVEVEKKLMFKFLKYNFPVIRIKHNMRFRRAIRLDNGMYFIFGEKSSLSELKNQLVKILMEVFDCDESICSVVLDSFLSIK